MSRQKPQAARRSRWAPRFGLRSLLLATTVVCLVFGAWSVYVDPYREQAAAVALIRQLGGTVEMQAANGPVWQAYLVETMVGESSYAEAARVDLQNAQIPDESQAQLSRLPFVQEMNLDRSNADDRAIFALGRAPNLVSLSLRYTAVTDRSLEKIALFPSLARLRLTGAGVGDAGLASLAESPALRELFIRWTAATDEGVARFCEVRPECEVHFHTTLVGP